MQGHRMRHDGRLGNAEAQHRAGQAAARRMLVPAQRRVQHSCEGDHWNGYPRAYYLRDIVQAQLALDDAAGAARTAQTITTPDYRARALQATGQVRDQGQGGITANGGFSSQALNWLTFTPLNVWLGAVSVV